MHVQMLKSDLRSQVYSALGDFNPHGLLITNADTATFASGYAVSWMNPNNVGNSLRFVAATDDTKYYQVSLYLGGGGAAERWDFSRLEIEYSPRGSQSYEALEPFSPFDSEHRFAYKKPTAGIFPIIGERIANLDTTVGQPTGWNVKARGAIAPAWASSQTVVIGQLTTGASGVYYALNAGTTAGSQPTGTTTDTTSDSNIDWVYYAPTADLVNSALTW
jgi:hypothetical protein